MTTIQQQLRECLNGTEDTVSTGDDEMVLECYYQDNPGEVRCYCTDDGVDCTHRVPIIGPVTVAELPTRDFSDDYGGPRGEPTICFSPRYVYIRVQYDGSEWFEAIPRHPEHLGTTIPWPGL